MVRISKVIELGLSEQVLEAYKRTNNYSKVAKEFNLGVNHIRNFILSTENKTDELITQDKVSAKKNLVHSNNALEKLVEKLEDIEGLLVQMKDEDGTVTEGRIREYIVAWKGATETLQWFIDKKIKLQETIENQVFRDKIIKAIEEASPEVAAKIKDAIEKERDKWGLV